MQGTGQTYTQAAVSLAAPAQMNRDLPPSGAASTLMFAEIMAVGRRAALAASDDLAGAAAAVQAALTPMSTWTGMAARTGWPRSPRCAPATASRGRAR
jgi:hypothetical protein